jgi:hypothetical protein
MQEPCATLMSPAAAQGTGPQLIRIVPCETSSPPAPDYVIERPGYRVHIARSLMHRKQAALLVERMYAWRGYRSTAAPVARPTASNMTFVATTERQVIGTLTLRLDTAQGLLAEGLYADQVNALRADRRRLCELSKLAVDPEHSAKELLASLIQLAHVYARMMDRRSDAIIEVNPRHAAFYKRMLGFSQIGEVRTCARVGAPAVLLHLDLGYMDAQIETHQGGARAAHASLYPCFLPFDAIAARVVARAA